MKSTAPNETPSATPASHQHGSSRWSHWLAIGGAAAVTALLLWSRASFRRATTLPARSWQRPTAHPTEAPCAPPTLKRGPGLHSGHDLPIRFMSWNVLADELTGGFPHTDPNALRWQPRARLIRSQLRQHTVDVIGLCECDHFDDVRAMLPEDTFSAYFAKKENEGSDGCAIFVRIGRWEITRQWRIRLGVHASQVAVFTLLTERAQSEAVAPDQTPLLVVMTHLKAKPGFESERERQVGHILTEVRRVTSLQSVGKARVVIMGDFNDTPESRVGMAMRAAGFASAYEGHHASDASRNWTTSKERDTVVTRVIDYIWYRPEQMEVDTVLEVPPLADTFPDHLPDVHYPSDHIALAAALRRR